MVGVVGLVFNDGDGCDVFGFFVGVFIGFCDGVLDDDFFKVFIDFLGYDFEVLQVVFIVRGVEEVEYVFDDFCGGVVVGVDDCGGVGDFVVGEFQFCGVGEGGYFGFFFGLDWFCVGFFFFDMININFCCVLC